MAEATETIGSMKAHCWKWKIIRNSGSISKSVNLAADFVSCRISGPVRRIEKRFATQAAVGEIIRADRWTSNETASFKRFLTTNRTGRTINIALLPSRQEQWFPLRVAVLFKSRAALFSRTSGGPRTRGVFSAHFCGCRHGITALCI